MNYQVSLQTSVFNLEFGFLFEVTSRASEVAEGTPSTS